MMVILVMVTSIMGKQLGEMYSMTYIWEPYIVFHNIESHKKIVQS